MNATFWRVGAVLALLVVALAAPAQAQNWPQRTVKFIVPFGPGAGADIGARLLAVKPQAKWGQPVVIESKPGGDGGPAAFACSFAEQSANVAAVVEALDLEPNY